MKYDMEMLESEISKIDFKVNEKIITPNRDGINDNANFTELTKYRSIRIIQGREENVTVTICDLRGSVVKQTENPNGWDGTDNDGEPVASGIYIYQYRANNKLITGTVVVAR